MSSVLERTGLAPVKPEAGRNEEPAFEPVGKLGDGSNSLRWWTLSQRIRTFAELAFEVALSETVEPPKYQQVANNALHLNQLGPSSGAVARYISVDGKTVAKALNWAQDKS